MAPSSDQDDGGCTPGESDSGIGCKENARGSKKDWWDIAQVLAAVALPFSILGLGWYSHVDRQDLSKVEIQRNLLVSIVQTSSEDRDTLLKFAYFAARSIGDADFMDFIETLNEKKLQEIRVSRLSEQDPAVLRENIRFYKKGAFKDAIETADTYLDQGHYYRAANHYITASENLPPGLPFDFELLRDAQESDLADPKTVSNIYRKFLRPHRPQSGTFR